MNAHNISLSDVRVRVAAAVGGLACLGALATGALLQQSSTAVADGDMQLGTTVTPTAPANAPAIAKAEPAIKGPAPLPTEEQGLPG
ncbi:MAG: hypothetical protein HYZ39_25190 [Mycolicibacterium cosmeticum]|nr:hypothetical protein [Mycolicibacterium cosmeticum]